MEYDTIKTEIKEEDEDVEDTDDIFDEYQIHLEDKSIFRSEGNLENENIEVFTVNSNDTIKVKAEPLEETLPFLGVIGESIHIKTENIKQEEYVADFDKPLDENSNSNEKTWIDSADIKEELNEDSDSSDYFIETCPTTGNVGQNYSIEVESKVFKQEYAVIKEDIDVENHCIKSENDQNAKSKQQIYECNLCDYKTNFESSLNLHSEVHGDPNKLKRYHCTECNYKTKQKCHLTRHKLVHRPLEDLELFACAECSWVFKQKCALKRHIREVHMRDTNRKNSPAATERLQCDQCSYSTVRKSLLQSHLDKHKDASDINNLYICDICKFSTKYRRNLRVHLETHQESRNLQIHECTICSFRTRLGYCLKRHLLSKIHLQKVGKLQEYTPRPMKMKQEDESV